MLKHEKPYHFQRQIRLLLPDNGPRAQKSHTHIPVIVSQGEGYRIWHRKDDEFNVPKGHLYLSLDSAHASASPRHAALTRLYVEMLLGFFNRIYLSGRSGRF